MAKYALKDVASFEGELVISSKRQTNPGTTKIMIRKSHSIPLKKLKYKIEKEPNNKVLYRERFIQQIQKRVMNLIDQNTVLKIISTTKEALFHVQ